VKPLAGTNVPGRGSEQRACRAPVCVTRTHEARGTAKLRGLQAGSGVVRVGSSRSPDSTRSDWRRRDERAARCSRRLQYISTNRVDLRGTKETRADSRNRSKRQRVNGLRPQLAHRQTVKNLPKYRQFRVRLPPRDIWANLQITPIPNTGGTLRRFVLCGPYRHPLSASSASP